MVEVGRIGACCYAAGVRELHEAYMIANSFYKGIEIQVPVAVMVQGILDFNLSGIEERRQLMYKFEKDTFLQIIENRSKAVAIDLKI